MMILGPQRPFGRGCAADISLTILQVWKEHAQGVFGSKFARVRSPRKYAIPPACCCAFLIRLFINSNRLISHNFLRTETPMLEDLSQEKISHRQ
jgi:hypothetical protein